MPRKICFVLTNFDGGGAERVTLNILSRLDTRHFQTTLIVFKGTGPLKDMVPPEITVYDLSVSRLRFAFPKLIKRIWQENPDVVFATQGFINLGLLLIKPFLPKNTKILIRESNTPSLDIPNRPSPYLTDLMYRLFYRFADLVFAQHKMAASEMIKDFSVKKENICLLANPVDTKAIRKAAEIPRRIDGPGLRIVSAGRLVRQKGFDRFIPLMCDLPKNSHLLIFGQGSELLSLKNQIAHLGLEKQVTLAGFEKVISPWLAGADVCILPSRWEGMPNIVLESLCCGTPAIVSPESGGVFELAEEVDEGSVDVAAVGEAFFKAVGAVKPRSENYLRPNLLPLRYDIEAVKDIFCGAVENIANPNDRTDNSSQSNTTG